ncbi:MAG: N-acetylneuraminate synthase family protein [Candidatus Paceibacteria bacterium]
MKANIIAETCQNHNGDREILGKMIKSAAEAGATHAKSQMIFFDDLTHRLRFDTGFREENGVVKTITRPYNAELERLKKLDLTEEDHRWFIEECARNNITPLTTVFSRRGIELAKKLKWPESIVKVSIQDIISLPFLRKLCDVFNHIILSTGGATDEEIKTAAKVIKEKGNKLTLLHCVSIYPNPLNLCNIARMKLLKEFADHVGFSDHTHVETDGIKASKVAIMEGAEFIERHFSVLNAEETKDGPISIGPELLHELVEFANLPDEIRDKEIFPQAAGDVRYIDIVGSKERELSAKELLTIDYMRGRFATDNKFNWEE